MIGIIFEGEELTKKVVEKAAELKQTRFIPIAQLTLLGIEERGPKMREAKKNNFLCTQTGGARAFYHARWF